MKLPTPQFSRLVTLLAFDILNPSLDSMILAWDHISSRFLNRPGRDMALSGRLESIRLLAIHDAVHAVLNPSGGFIFNEQSAVHSLDAALAAAARASHDILAAALTSPEDLEALSISLEESLSLVGSAHEREAGAAIGAASAASFVRTFDPLVPVEKGRAALEVIGRHGSWAEHLLEINAARFGLPLSA